MRKAIIAALLAALLCVGCEKEEDEEPIVIRPPELEHNYEGVFSDEAECAPRSGVPEARYAVTNVEYSKSPDGRWHAYSPTKSYASELVLYDTVGKTKFKIGHPQKGIYLSDFQFSRNAKYLSFVGTPWGMYGVSEIFTVNLENMSHTSYGLPGYCYRRPIFVEEDGSLLFFVGFPGLIERHMATHARVESIATTAGRYHENSGETYMPTLESPMTDSQAFIKSPQEWVVNVTYKLFEIFEGVGILPDENIGRYLFVDGQFEANAEITPTKALQYMSEVPVEISQDNIVALESRPVLRMEALPLLRPPLRKEFLNEQYQEEFVCLDNSQVR